jgi:hypothetical protein
VAAFMFVAAGLMGMHFKLCQDTFSQCPTPVAVGPNDTGKTTSAKFFLSIVGRLNTGLARQLSVAEASTKYSSSTIPIVFDDPDNIADVRTIVNNTFNEQERATKRDTVTPRTLAMFTINEDKIRGLLDNARYSIHFFPVG